MIYHTGGRNGDGIIELGPSRCCAELVLLLCFVDGDCDFDSRAWCGWKNVPNDGSEWQRVSGIKDHTSGTGKYIRANKVNTVFRLAGPSFQKTSSRCTMKFYYKTKKIGGRSRKAVASKLTVSISKRAGKTMTSVNLKTYTLRLVSSWSAKTVSIPVQRNAFSINITASVKTYAVFIDDIVFVGCQSAAVPGVRPCSEDQFMCDSGDCVALTARCDSSYECADFSDERGCPSNPGTCRFDTSICDWSNAKGPATGNLADTIDWARTSGSRSGNLPAAPSSDHSRSGQSGSYLHIGTTKLSSKKGTAVLVSPLLPKPNYPYCRLTFYYNFGGSGDGSLSVKWLATGSSVPTTLWQWKQLTGSGWQRAAVTIPALSVTQSTYKVCSCIF